MKPIELLTLTLGVISSLLIPLMVILIRGAIKWARVESKLDHAIEELRSISADKDRVHTEIYSQMREDREVTNKRLRWLEEHLWNREARR